MKPELVFAVLRYATGQHEVETMYIALAIVAWGVSLRRRYGLPPIPLTDDFAEQLSKGAARMPFGVQ